MDLSVVLRHHHQQFLQPSALVNRCNRMEKKTSDPNAIPSFFSIRKAMIQVGSVGVIRQYPIVKTAYFQSSTQLADLRPAGANMEVDEPNVRLRSVKAQ